MKVAGRWMVKWVMFRVRQRLGKVGGTSLKLSYFCTASSSHLRTVLL